MTKQVFFMLLALVGITWGYGQQLQVSGTVTSSEDQMPMPGASVQIKGTSTGVVTDFDGVYTLPSVAVTDTLVVSYIGFKTMWIPVAGKSTIDVILSVDNNQLEEVVIVGYSTQKKADITGAIAAVNMDETLKETNTNVGSSLQGRVAGVAISASGAPGSTANIVIRGVGSFGSGNDPLYIIDGIQSNNMNGLNPEDIESIQVLKDAASASIYGSRGGNGVILITTKKGKTDQVALTFSSYVRFSHIRNKLDMMSSQQYGDAYLQALINDGNPPAVGSTFAGGNYTYDGTGAVINEYINQNPLTRAANTDWQDEVFKTAITQNYDLGLSQAKDKSNYYFGLGYAKEDGIFVYTNYERYSAKLNTNFSLFNDKLTIGENISMSHETRVDPFEGRTYEDAIFQHPLIPVYDEEGNFGGAAPAGTGDRLNPVGRQYRNRNNKRKIYKTFGDIHAELALAKGLKTKSIIGFEYETQRFTFFEPSYIEGRFTNSISKLREEYSNNINLRYTQLLSYDWSDEHNELNAIAGFETFSGKFESFYASDRSFFLESTDYVNLGSGAFNDNNGGGKSQSATQSFFGKVNYGLFDKYLFSATLRRDESSRFGSNNRVGYFPSFTLGWKLSNEKFLSDSETISNMKLRLSYGQAGNDRIGDYTQNTIFYYNPNFSGYDISGSNTGNNQGFIVQQLGNPNVGWETSETYNVGLDGAFLDNRLTYSLDYFKRNTKDLLYQKPLLAVEGEGNAPFLNVGEVQNKGFEAVLSYRNEASKAFQYKVDFNVTTIQNKVVSIADGIDDVVNGFTILKTGEAIGVFYGYKTDGLFRSQEEVDAYVDQPGKGVGRIRYVDVNGDGVIDVDDRTVIGNPFPDFSAGLNLSASYKNFDASLFFDGTFGNDIYDTYKGLVTTFYYESNHGAAVLDAFSPDNPTSNIPALTLRNTNDELRASDYFIDKGTFVRLKSLSVGYTVPTSLIKKLKISNLRIYVQGQNLINWTDFGGFDYEVGNNSGILSQATYPHSKSYSIGINANF